jgi:hypothetical protein
LGEGTPLRHAVDEKARQLQRIGAVPPEPPNWPLVNSTDVPQIVQDVSAWLLRKFPRLTKYSPAIPEFILQRSLEAALCTNWERARETLDHQIKLWYTAHDLHTRADAYHLRWEANQLPRLGTQVLAPEQTDPVLLDPVYRDPGPVRINMVLPVIMIPWWPEQSYEERHNALERAADAIAQRHAGSKPQPLVGRATGPRRRYHAMRDCYRRWLEAGAPGTLKEPGSVPGVRGYARQHLKDGIDWLHPENVDDFALEE